ncbi:MAG: glycosyltransferase [Rhodocyclaceae bacterium]|nr:glycosyltransferase [Rhodocyclaceae bacterium]
MLTIGMPVYNGERFIAQALQSLIAQEFRDWTMLVADNCSTDGTADIVEAFCRQDSRIRLVRHDHNLGAVPNFVFLAEQAKTPYFMWAAADDEWSANYVGACVAVLEADRKIGFASGAVVNTDLQGAHIRTYKPFSEFCKRGAVARLVSFALAREADGKANMIYSVYRTPLVQAVCRIPDIFEGWGSDMAFVAAVLARGRYAQMPEAVLLKRVVSDSDLNTARLLNAGRYEQIQFGGHYPPEAYHAYATALIRGMPTFALRSVMAFTMLRRRLLLILCRMSSLQ